MYKELLIDAIVEEITAESDWLVMDDNHCRCGCCRDEYHSVNYSEALVVANRIVERMEKEKLKLTISE